MATTSTNGRAIIFPAPGIAGLGSKLENWETLVCPQWNFWKSGFRVLLGIAPRRGCQQWGMNGKRWAQMQILRQLAPNNTFKPQTIVWIHETLRLCGKRVGEKPIMSESGPLLGRADGNSWEFIFFKFQKHVGGITAIGNLPNLHDCQYIALNLNTVWNPQHNSISWVNGRDIVHSSEEVYGDVIKSVIRIIIEWSK